VVHPDTGGGAFLIQPFRAIGRMKNLNSRAPKSKRRLVIMPNRQAFQIARSLYDEVRSAGSIFPSAFLHRNSSNMRGISILTGQASWQAPQSEEAFGRLLASFKPVITGETIDPIGPG
jgi:hypothetical protein